MIPVSNPTRETPIGVMATVLAIGCLIGMVATAVAGGWWWILFAALLFVAACCGYGAADSFQLKHRDTDGNQTT